MKYETTFRIIKSNQSEKSKLVLNSLNAQTVDELEKLEYVNLLKLKFNLTKPIILEDIEIQLESLMNSHSIERKYIGKVINNNFVTFIFYCKIDTEYHIKIGRILNELGEQVELIKRADPLWNLAHKLLESDE